MSGLVHKRAGHHLPRRRAGERRRAERVDETATPGRNSPELWDFAWYRKGGTDTGLTKTVRARDTATIRARCLAEAPGTEGGKGNVSQLDGAGGFAVFPAFDLPFRRPEHVNIDGGGDRDAACHPGVRVRVIAGTDGSLLSEIRRTWVRHVTYLPVSIGGGEMPRRTGEGTCDEYLFWQCASLRPRLR
ncbi:hypothetical protein [Symbioplanes lichenis]|uniref:hypothetical protein n=1 Tax=Symbioplanes lichenis TaxID=1629072 RepID=UPI002739AAFD|nr:hypothetical protein [Actinoplanes lichenis]